MISELEKKIISKKFTIGVVGLGYVGMPLMIRFLNSKIKVFGVDQSREKISLIKKGLSYIKSIQSKIINKFKNNCSTDYKILNNVNVVFICLPTPLKNNKPDLSYLKKSFLELSKLDLTNKLLILESTVFPGVTRKLVNDLLKKKKLKIGVNFFAGYSPERENPGDTSFSYKKTPKVVSGYTSRCLKLVESCYFNIAKKITKAKNLEVAETSKLLENIYRAVNIGMINEMKIICDNLKLDINQVIDCASTKNFGFQPFYPGPGWGGHCIPIDPFYLTWISKQNGYEPLFIKNAGLVNNSMPKWIMSKVFLYVKKLNKKKIKVLLLGISYKKNVDDDRESPSHQFIKILTKKKIDFDFSDPYFSYLRKGRNIKMYKKSIKLNSFNLKKYDCVILITDHDKFNYDLILKNSKMIFDTRGVFKNYSKKNIIQC